MKIYEKIAIILQESSTTDSKRNKLVKLRYDITDSQLLTMVDNLIFALKYYLKGGYTRQLTPEEKAKGIPGNWTDSRTLIINCTSALRVYVDNRILERVPQWQIEALKHGWIPPNR